MRFGPKLSVGQRLTFTMILVVVLSLGLGAVLGYQARQHGLFRPARIEPPPAPRAPAGQPRGSADRGLRSKPPTGGAGLSPARTGEHAGEPGTGPPGSAPGPRRPRRPFPLLNPFFLIDLAVGIIVALVAGLWLSRRFTRPLALLAEGASALQTGDLSHRIPVAGEDEFGRVAVSMNQMAERIGDQLEALRADSRRRQQLLADVSHELRSPVTTLRTMAEALRDGLAASPERSDRAVHAILESALRMERLVNDLIELARLDLDEFPLHPVSVEVRAAVADCLRRYREAAAQAGIRLHPVADGAPIVVSADPHRLAQILDNLVDNAVSHAGEGAEVTVTIEAGNPVTIVVTDTGRGIPAEHLPYLFDAFYRGDAVRTPGGRHSGLGLRIARGLAQAHGGDLRITSVEYQGTSAFLTLPAQ